MAVAPRLPNFRGAEMAAVRIGITDVLHDPEFPRLKKFVQCLARRVQSLRCVQAECFLSRNRERRTQPVIMVILERDERVQSVVAARELNEHENWAAGFGAGNFGADGLREKGGSVATEREEADAAAGELDELATRRGKPGGKRGVGHGRSAELIFRRLKDHGGRLPQAPSLFPRGCLAQER